MKRQVEILLLTMAGAAVLRISLFGDVYLRYVKEGLRLPLIAAGIVLIALGLAGAWRDGFPFPYERAAVASGRDGAEDAHGDGPAQGDTRDAHGHAEVGQDPQSEHGHEHGHGHDHSRGPSVAWLLFLPVVGLLFSAPPALASYTAERQRPMAVEEQARFDPLPAGSPLPMTLLDFSTRAVWDKERSLKGRTVRMTGFVTRGKGERWYLTRLMLGCCAADAQAIKVEMNGGSPPSSGAWVTVTGTWRPSGEPGTAKARAALDVTGLRRIPEPENPYNDTAG
ncbi:TIGR03943 family protein [Streptomyces sp. XD-27]|uniref:TIGR03943 family putative permease subunit n=1 Tax=Streptomyces sp. XD-27 TaxID=3062779 RepID=UPI0026F43493|nr:TIGR03943 family protein [Streptomyces sp. XD-27]WKX68959.1 TIGR03943 family protein [Streptomyces sp. XD-27]